MRHRRHRHRESRPRERRASASAGSWTVGPLTALLILGLARPGAGQEAPLATVDRAQREPTAAAEREGETAREARRDPLLRRADLAYAAAFFGSLALSEPLRGLDRTLDGLADGDRRGADHLFYTAGDWAGDLWIDLGAAALTLGVGELSGSSRVSRLGLRSLESLAAVDLLATLFKVGVGRQRPSSTADPGVFEPIAWNHDFASFPSGHTAHAFALAATASRELGGWTPWLAYPLATGVGVSRVIGGEHWATDIVAGAALGIFTAGLTDRLHTRGRSAGAAEPSGPRLTAVPMPGPGLLLGAEVRPR